MQQRDEGFGPVMKGRASRVPRRSLERRPRRRGGVLRLLGTGLLVVLLLLAIFGAGVGLYASSRIARVPVTGLDSSMPMHILVTGSDSRADLTREERVELTTGSELGERTDTIFVMTVSGGETALLAFPRDLYVTRCDGSAGRINAAAGIGGAGCLVETVSQVSGLPISHWIQVDFGGFRDIVDAVGGVEVCLEAPIADRDAGIDLPAGCQRLAGSDALGYVRVRKIDNDLERIKRQQGFLKALASEIAAPSTLFNPVRLVETAGEIGGALTADAALDTLDLLRLGWAARGLAGGGTPTHTVPGTPTTINGAAVLEVAQSEAQPLFDRFRSGAVLGERIASGNDDAALDPADVELAVRNGAGVEGLASRAAGMFRDAGFTVTDVGNADPVDATVVRYPPGAAVAAQAVADALGADIRVEEDASVSAVTVLLGPDAVPVD